VEEWTELPGLENSPPFRVAVASGRVKFAFAALANDPLQFGQGARSASAGATASRSTAFANVTVLFSHTSMSRRAASVGLGRSQPNGHESCESCHDPATAATLVFIVPVTQAPLSYVRTANGDRAAGHLRAADPRGRRPSRKERQCAGSSSSSPFPCLRSSSPATPGTRHWPAGSGRPSGRGPIPILIA
jgi:hypothetical protein